MRLHFSIGSFSARLIFRAGTNPRGPLPTRGNGEIRAARFRAGGARDRPRRGQRQRQAQAAKDRTGRRKSGCAPARGRPPAQFPDRARPAPQNTQGAPQTATRDSRLRGAPGAQQQALEGPSGGQPGHHHPKSTLLQVPGERFASQPPGGPNETHSVFDLLGLVFLFVSGCFFW
jgi:hypothetical protein